MMYKNLPLYINKTSRLCYLHRQSHIAMKESTAAHQIVGLNASTTSTYYDILGKIDGSPNSRSDCIDVHGILEKIDSSPNSRSYCIDIHDILERIDGCSPNIWSDCIDVPDTLEKIDSSPNSRKATRC
ncbi:hypothetical protein PTT_10093 [Pyrenophora teres f. teres 0-1]|uniref:Uncharacterized protein n=1 Tax=Pyrenophora teres f. teres (strain 0-1) TaxID=861557 RepID=E3RNF3_PYRTT|nr:hypothetical protein PTT_10093 [Pyrenophora teres f. teres 0-1]